MDKLIYADALMKRIPFTEWCVIENIVESMPAVDAVPVVRCRNCEYYNTACCADGFGWCERNGNGHPATDNFYCANGEQKNANRYRYMGAL